MLEDTIILKNPEREGYEFTGWTGTAGLTEAVKTVEIPAGSSGERQYTAIGRPSPTSFLIIWSAEPSRSQMPESYTVESDEITLKNPALEKYDFSTCHGTGLTESTMEVKISRGSMETEAIRQPGRRMIRRRKSADMALEAVSGGFESRIEDLPELGEEAELDARVLEAVREALQNALHEDERISAYLDAISMTVVQVRWRTHNK